MEWIRVKDSLPDRDGKYLVYETHPYGGFERIAYWTSKYDGFEEHLEGKAIWFDYDSEYGDFEIDGITHWMPLPEEPED